MLSAIFHVEYYVKHVGWTLRKGMMQVNASLNTYFINHVFLITLTNVNDQ